MSGDRNPIPFKLNDQPSSERDEQPSFDDIGVKPVGHVVSSRGVELVAIEGKHDKSVSHDMTSVGWVFHTYVTPPKATLRIDAGAENPMPRFYFLPPNTPIQWRSSPSVNTACLFGQDFVRELLEAEPDLAFTSLDCVVTKESSRLAYLAQQVLRETLSPGFGAGLLAESIALQIALEIVRCDRRHRPDEAPLRGGLAPWQMRRLESYVREHLSDDLSLQSLAELLGMSTRHLSRVVKQDKGISVHRWVAELRFAEAQRLLAENDLSLQEISQRTAFKSAAAFSVAFRAAAGLSPSEYRRLACK